MHTNSACAGNSHSLVGQGRGNGNPRQPSSPIWEAPSLKRETCRTRLTGGSVGGGQVLGVTRRSSVQPHEGKSAAPEGPGVEIRGSRGSPIRMRDLNPS